MVSREEMLAREPMKRPTVASLKKVTPENLATLQVDADVLAQCFSAMEPADSWLRQPDRIEACLREIAGSLLGYAVALVEAKRFRDAVGNVDVTPGGVHSMTRDELAAAFQTSSRGHGAERCGRRTIVSGSGPRASIVTMKSPGRTCTRSMLSGSRRAASADSMAMG